MLCTNPTKIVNLLQSQFQVTTIDGAGFFFFFVHTMGGHTAYNIGKILTIGFGANQQRNPFKSFNVSA